MMDKRLYMLHSNYGLVGILKMDLPDGYVTLSCFGDGLLRPKYKWYAIKFSNDTKASQNHLEFAQYKGFEAWLREHGYL